LDFAGFDARAQWQRIKRINAGDRLAFGEIYDDTFTQVYRYAFSLVLKPEDAEDLTAETYERALRTIQKYESRDVPISIWLLRITRNVHRERLQRVRREPPTPIPVDRLPDIPARQERADEPVPWERMLAELTPDQRDVITLRLAGLKGREIATALGKAEGTVKALQFAAIRNLRRSTNR
jgi:RNA polymerase sigma-70 factor, ECF subfamily